MNIGILNGGQYREMILNDGDRLVPLRPSAGHLWEDGAWVQLIGDLDEDGEPVPPPDWPERNDNAIGVMGVDGAYREIALLDGDEQVAHRPSAEHRWQDGAWVHVPPVIDLDAIKADAKRAVIARANAFTAPILAAYPEAERAGWDKREAEARAIIAASDKAAAIAGTVIIKALAAAAGEDAAATVARAERIVAKAQEFAAISAAVEVMRDQSLATIDAVDDAAEMQAALDALDAQATALAKQYGLA